MASTDPLIKKQAGLLKTRRVYQDHVRSFFTENIDPELFSKKFFYRNFHFLTLVRYILIGIVLIPTQNFKVAQLCIICLMIIPFSCYTIYHITKHKFLTPKTYHWMNLIIEGLIVLIMILMLTLTLLRTYNFLTIGVIKYMTLVIVLSVTICVLTQVIGTFFLVIIQIRYFWK